MRHRFSAKLDGRKSLNKADWQFVGEPDGYISVPVNAGAVLALDQTLHEFNVR